MLKIAFSYLKQNKLIVSIIFLALFLRLFGITHGFPYIFHPDEPTIVRSALGVRFFPNPKHFDWPHLYIYLNYFVYMSFAAFREGLEIISLKSFASAIFPIIWDDTLVFYLITRIFTATLGALTALPVYLAGKKLFNERIALLGALSMTLLPFSVHHSHYSLTDAPMTFLVAWVLYFSACILTDFSLKNFIKAGFFVGLAASTKYNGGLSALLVAVAFFVYFLGKNPPFPQIIKNSYKPITSAIFALIGFLLGTPFALLDYKTFSRTDGPKGAYWQFTNVGSRSFSSQVSQFFSAFLDKFPSDWSFVFVILFVFGLVLFIHKILSKKISIFQIQALTLLYPPALAFLFYVSGFSKNRSHYYMMAYPLIALSIGWVAAEITKSLSKKAYLFVLTLIFIVPLGMSLKNSIAFARTDTRILALQWYQDNLSILEQKTYKIYYDGSDLDLTLPPLAKKLPEKTSKFEYPFVLFSFCDKVKIQNTPDFIISNFLRRGDPICIYKIPSQDDLQK